MYTAEELPATGTAYGRRSADRVQALSLSDNVKYDHRTYLNSSIPIFLFGRDVNSVMKIHGVFSSVYVCV